MKKKLLFKDTIFYILYKATLEKVMGSNKPILESIYFRKMVFIGDALQQSRPCNPIKQICRMLSQERGVSVAK
jgi:hypothetical protein